MARAEGVPLYAVEIVRMLVADGTLVRDGDRYRVVGSLDRVSVPETLQALVAVRLDGLDASRPNPAPGGVGAWAELAASPPSRA